MRSWLWALGLLLVGASISSVAARGGRGRGGGSFGGLFGGWRKYKKPSSSGGGRRVVSGSPVHTAMTVPKPPPPPPPPPKPMVLPPPKQQHLPGSYPRQQMPPGYGYGYGSASATGSHQGTFYASPQALPPGAMYYAHPPMGMNRGMSTGDFLTGMLAGHMMNNLLFGHRRHVSHVYHRNGEPSTQNNDRQIIIVNNGHPAEGAVPQNETETSQEASENPLTAEEQEEGAESEGASEESPEGSATAQPLPSGGIICFPIMLNETDPGNPEVVREVERVVCFPAPSPNGSENSSPTSTTEPPIVAGDIGGGGEEVAEGAEGAEGAGDGVGAEGSEPGAGAGAVTEVPVDAA